MQVISLRNTSYIANVSSIIHYIATRFKVSNVLVTHVDRAICDVNGVRTKFHFWTICSIGNGIDVYQVFIHIIFNNAFSIYRSCCVSTICEVQTFIQCNFLFVCAIRFISQRNLFSSFIIIECYLVSCVMVCFILYRCNSDRVIVIVCIIYSHCFTSCIFNVVTGYVYFVSCTSFAELITCFRRYFSDIFIARASYICFSLYFFSRSCSRCYVVNIYSVDSFTATICILNYVACYFRSIFTLNLNSAVQFIFSTVGQVSYYIATGCCCFNVLTIVSTYHTEAQATLFVQSL